ncbi:MAG: secretin N-terminal domain-containing protein, partial [Gemmatimonadota bacterium]
MTPRWLVCAACLLGAVAHAQEPAPVRAVAGGGVQFDFQDADLRLVLSALAEAGHLNLVYSELPQRHITLRTNQPIAPDQILPLLRSLAASNGLKVTEDGSFIRIEDTGTAPSSRDAARAQSHDSTSAEVRLFVYRLKHARAVKLAGTLQSIFGGHGTDYTAALGEANPTLSEELRQQQVPPTEIPGQPAVSVQLGRTRLPSLPGRLRGDVQIVPDEATNSLLVRAQ